MKTLLASTAIASLIALPLAAQSVTDTVTDSAGVGVEAGADVSVGADATLKTGADGAAAEVGTGLAADTKVQAGDKTMVEGAMVEGDIDYAAVITGQPVYDANDERVGEVAEVAVSEGRTWAIVDVGGFLGIGEKPVALDVAELQIIQDPENADKVKIGTALTRDQLEALPTYEMAAAAGATLETDAKVAAQAGETDAAKVAEGTKVGTETQVATDITGKRVYDANDEWIGEVSEMVVADGKSWAIIDVGGFLGIGEKPVALDLSQLNIVQDGNDAADVKVSVALTKAELKAMPTYEK